MLLAIRKEGSTVTEQEVLEFLKDKIVKWWMPDAVVFVDELPHTATGKLLKTGVREQYKNWLVENGRG